MWQIYDKDPQKVLEFFLHGQECSFTKMDKNKTEVESVQLGNTYIAYMDKCPQNKCRGDSCNLLFMFPGPFV